MDSSKKVDHILETIMAFARLDFSKKITLSDHEDDPLDAISGGVNMLGEELQISTVSLKEKERLLKEIHHRVKNNLQIVSSLLNLQSDNITDPKYLELIRESRNRISSMALVHEMLYRSSSLNYINAKEYIEKLCNSIYHSYIQPNRNIHFDFQIHPVLNFDIDKMIPLGLIINEIISNSFKHAFQNEDGLIHISFQETTDKKHRVQIYDNGKGLPVNFDPDKHSNLGIQLIFMLAEQLDGKAEMIKNMKTGTGYSITFP